MNNVSSWRQALVLLAALPPAQLQAVLSRLAPDEEAWVKDHLARGEQLDSAELNTAVRSFVQRSQAQSPAHPEPPRELSGSIEESPAASPASITAGSAAAQLAALCDDLSPEKCLELFQGEEASFVAAVLFALSGKRCAELVERMELRDRSRVLLDLAQISEVPAPTLEFIRQKLQRKLEFGGSLHARPEGIHRIRQMLEHLDPVVQGSIADTLAASDPALAAELHRNVFRFNDLLRLNRADIRKLLAFVDSTAWAPALRYADERVRQHIFACISATALKTLKLELEGLAELPADQSLARQQQIVLVTQELFRKRMIARPKSAEAVSQAA